MLLAHSWERAAHLVARRGEVIRGYGMDHERLDQALASSRAHMIDQFRAKHRHA